MASWIVVLQTLISQENDFKLEKEISFMIDVIYVSEIVAWSCFLSKTPVSMMNMKD